MKREELTKTFMVISRGKSSLVSMVHTEIVSALRVKLKLCTCWFKLQCYIPILYAVLCYKNYHKCTRKRGINIVRTFMILLIETLQYICHQKYKLIIIYVEKINKNIILVFKYC